MKVKVFYEKNIDIYILVKILLYTGNLIPLLVTI